MIFVFVGYSFKTMAYHRGQNSTFEFDVVVYNFYLDLQLNIQVSYFSTLLVDLTCLFHDSTLL